jgi:hypothetical protein
VGEGIRLRGQQATGEGVGTVDQRAGRGHGGSRKAGEGITGQLCAGPRYIQVAIDANERPVGAGDWEFEVEVWRGNGKRAERRSENRGNARPRCRRLPRNWPYKLSERSSSGLLKTGWAGTFRIRRQSGAATSRTRELPRSPRALLEVPVILIGMRQGLVFISRGVRSTC